MILPILRSLPAVTTGRRTNGIGRRRWLDTRDRDLAGGPRAASVRPPKPSSDEPSHRRRPRGSDFTMIKAIAALCLVAVAAGGGFLLGRRFTDRDTRQIGYWARCDATEVANPGLARALAAVAGSTLVIPSGCRLLIGPPAPATPAVVIPSATRIRCEGPTAGQLQLQLGGVA